MSRKNWERLKPPLWPVSTSAEPKFTNVVISAGPPTLTTWPACRANNVTSSGASFASASKRLCFSSAGFGAAAPSAFSFSNRDWVIALTSALN